MIRIVLIRAASSIYDQQGRLAGNLDIPLSDDAAATIKNWSAELLPLEIAALYCSPKGAALGTAKLLGEALRLKPKSLPELINMDLGFWQGMEVAEIEDKQAWLYKQWEEHPEKVQPPNGEMLAEVMERIEEALERIVKKQRAATTAIVMPEPLLSVARRRLTGCDWGNLWKIDENAPVWQAIELHPKLWRTEIALQPQPKPLNE